MPGSRKRSRRRNGGGKSRWLGVGAVLVACLVVLSLGLPSVSYQTASLDRSADSPVVSDSQNAVHGLDRVSSVSNDTTEPLVNVTNNFGSGSQPSLTYTVTVLNNTGSAGLDGSTGTNQVQFTRNPSESERQVNITTSTSTSITVKYAVNATGQDITVNTTRTVEVNAA